MTLRFNTIHSIIISRRTWLKKGQGQVPARKQRRCYQSCICVVNQLRCTETCQCSGDPKLMMMMMRKLVFKVMMMLMMRTVSIIMITLVFETYFYMYIVITIHLNPSLKIIKFDLFNNIVHYFELYIIKNM